MNSPSWWCVSGLFIVTFGSLKSKRLLKAQRECLKVKASYRKELFSSRPSLRFRHSTETYAQNIWCNQHQSIRWRSANALTMTWGLNILTAESLMKIASQPAIITSRWAKKLRTNLVLANWVFEKLWKIALIRSFFWEQHGARCNVYLKSRNRETFVCLTTSRVAKKKQFSGEKTFCRSKQIRLFYVNGNANFPSLRSSSKCGGVIFCKNSLEALIS